MMDDDGDEDGGNPWSHLPAPLYRKSANDPDNDYNGRINKMVHKLRAQPPQPHFSDLHRSVLKSRPFQQSVMDKHTDSITGKHLSKYLRRAVSAAEDEDVELTPSEALFFESLRAKPPLPPPYQALVDLQSPSTGLWVDREAVLRLLSMPTVYRMPGREDWEVASAIALAFLRQNADLHADLCPYHDRAMATGRLTADLLFEAREALASYRFETDLTEKDLTLELELDGYLDKFFQDLEQKRQAVAAGEVAAPQSPRPEHDEAVAVAGQRPGSGAPSSSSSGAGRRGTGPSPPARDNNDDWRAAYRRQYDVALYGADLTATEDDAAFAANVLSGGRSVEINHSIFFNVKDEDRVRQMQVQEARRQKAFGVVEVVEDESDVLHRRVKQIPSLLAEEASQGAEIEACKERLVRALAAVDAHLEALRRCEKRCTEDYKRAVLMADRNVAYEELSAMLGEGFEATNALNVAAWKSAGVPGYRPLVVAALNAVRDLSMAYRALDTTLRSLRELRKAEALIAKTNAYKAQVREKERRRAARVARGLDPDGDDEADARAAAEAEAAAAEALARAAAEARRLRDRRSSRRRSTYLQGTAASRAAGSRRGSHVGHSLSPSTSPSRRGSVAMAAASSGKGLEVRVRGHGQSHDAAPDVAAADGGSPTRRTSHLFARRRSSVVRAPAAAAPAAEVDEATAALLSLGLDPEAAKALQGTAPLGSVLGSKIGLSSFSIHFFWHGQDAVIKLLTSLDWLRDVPCLRRWYDRSFPFLCNPLMLPFSLAEPSCLRALGLQNRPNVQRVRQDWEVAAAAAEGGGGGGSGGSGGSGGADAEAERQAEQLALIKGGTAGGGDYYDAVERVDAFIDRDPLAKRPFFLAFRKKFNDLTDSRRRPMWPAVPNFYGYDDACIYPLWAFYKALLVLVTPPAIDWLRRARDYEDRFLRTEWLVTSVGDAGEYEYERQLDKLRPRPPPFTIEPVYARRAAELARARDEGRGAQVPKNQAFTYVPL